MMDKTEFGKVPTEAEAWSLFHIYEVWKFA